MKITHRLTDLHMGYKVIGRDEFDSFGKSFPIIHLQQPSLPDSKL